MRAGTTGGDSGNGAMPAHSAGQAEMRKQTHKNIGANASALAREPRPPPPPTLERGGPWCHHAVAAAAPPSAASLSSILGSRGSMSSPYWIDASTTARAYSMLPSLVGSSGTKLTML